MFLTDEALAQLTGLQRPSAMCRWLEREGIPFVVAADGKPRVLHAVIMGRLGGRVGAAVDEGRGAEPLALTSLWP